MGSQYQPWANPDPQSVAGLNSAMVYGQNIQCAVGVNHAVTVGSNIQICINPGTFIAMMGGPAAAALTSFFGAGGLGGNTQFTLGTNTTINWGQQYELDMGPEKVTYTADTPASKALCAAIGAVCIAYAIAFGADPDENGRATTVLIFQETVDILLSVLMIYHMVVKTGKQTTIQMLRALYSAEKAEHPNAWKNTGLLVAAAITGVVGAAVTPVVAIALEEGHFASQESQTQSSSTTSQNSQTPSSSNTSSGS